jgi:HPt (histidine-containing phosphotransfer) domain-containing protein
MDPRETRAYQLFLSQLEEMIAQGRGLAAEGAAADRLAMQQLFHKMKGGAGFFGLTEIAELADRLETICHTADELGQKRLDEILTALTILKGLSDQLR